MKSGSIIAFILIGVVIVALFLPQIRQASLKLRSETITLDTTNAAADQGVPNSLATLDIITILGKDGIPAILDPRFVTVEQAQGNMKPQERVLGVSINGESRAYPLNLLSRHEIVNDTVGAKAVAVTW
jgi:hypothetical protein